MNATEKFLLPDIQSEADGRNMPIDQVGVKGIRYPVLVRTGDGETAATIADLALTVALGPAVKGVHMSRFVELLESERGALDPAGFKALVYAMLDKLHTRSGAIEMRFPYFVRKRAPVSGVASLLDYEVCWRGSVSALGRYSFSLEVVVPVTSLCPCSKEISAYGAHNQRSHITIRADLVGDMSIEELAAVAEKSASCELFGLLKRPDEKYVTERAYDNPKFVEDLVRDIALALDREPRVRGFVVESENFESIHNHSAFARIERRAVGADSRRGGGDADGPCMTR